MIIIMVRISLMNNVLNRYPERMLLKYIVEKVFTYNRIFTLLITTSNTHSIIIIILVFTCNNAMCDMFFLRRVICLLFSLFIIIQWVSTYIIRIYRNYNNIYTIAPRGGSLEYLNILQRINQ